MNAESGGAAPIVDMAPFLFGDPAARATVARAFAAAFEQTGFAVIVNHGIPAPLVHTVYGRAREFFALPAAEKAKLDPPEQVKARGYLAMGIERVAATLSDQTPPDLCEALVFGSLQREASGRGKPNLWPVEPPGFARAIHDWSAEIHALCGRLMRMSALALELPEDWFDASFAEPSITLRFVNYPDQLEAPAAGQLRYGAHHDYGGLTILRQDDAPGGLQICDREGAWQAMPPVPDSFVVNVGDLMARWTNGRWRSTLHRVVNPPRALTGSTQRLSMVAFTGPHEATTVSCLPTCHGPLQPPRFEPVVAGDYVRAKLAASMELKPD